MAPITAPPSPPTAAPRGRPRHHRRLQDHHRGSRQPRPARTATHLRQDRQAGNKEGTGLTGLGHSSPPTPPGSISTSTATSAMAARRRRQRCLQHPAGLPRLLLRQQLQRVRPHLAGQRPGRPEVPQQGHRHPPACRCATTKGRWSVSARSSMCATTPRPGHGHALQHVLRHRHHRQHLPGHQLRPGHRPDARNRRRELPHSMAYDWTELTYLQLQAGNTAMFVFALAVHVRLPGAGRPVRKLVAAAGRHPGRADVPALLGHRRHARQHGGQHLHADRLRRAGRPGQQERDPDRRVRQGSAARRASTPLGSDHGSRHSCGCGRS